MDSNRRPIYSDSDVQTVSNTSRRNSRRESLSEYICTGKRYSLRRVSQDSVFAGTPRQNRAYSLTTQSIPPLRHEQRPLNLSDQSTVSFTNIRDIRANDMTNQPLRERRLLKTVSTSNILPPTGQATKRGSKGQLTLKRRKSLRKIQSLQSLDGVVKTSQSRRRHQPLVRFRKAVKTVQILLKATKSNRQGQQKGEVMSWTHYHEDVSTAKRTYDLFGISFDPSLFRANREKTLSNEAKSILSMDPKDRLPEQLKIALLALNQAVDAFGEFPKNMQRSLVRVGWYENFEAKRVIIRQGHMADNFYFILSGTAVVTILESNRQTGEEYVRTVALLKKGNSFGELALMHGARRSATVTCKNNVELLAVSREDFIDIFMHIERDREPEHITFLRTLDLLRGWPIEKLPYDNPKICLFTYFRRGVLLCKNSNTAEWIYIVKSGTCRVLKDLLATKPNIPGLEFIDYNIDQPFTKLPPITSPRTASSSDSSSCSQDNDGSGFLAMRKSPALRHKRKQTLKGLPTWYRRSDEEISATAAEHQHHIETIYEKRHKPVTQGKFRLKPVFEETPEKEHKKRRLEKVFVQIQKLGPKEIFGLENTVFSMMGSTTGCSLVSEGAECILINRRFFQQHLSDITAKRIRRTIQPIPTEESLQQKLQDKTNWEAYKSMTVCNFILFRNKVQDYDALYL